MFKNILFPTDGSIAAFRAAAGLAHLAASDAGDVYVTVTVVIAPIDADRTDLSEEIVAHQNTRIRLQAQEMLDRTAELFAERRVLHTTLILEGDPASAVIAREAETGGYDLVVMGSRGMSMQKDDQRYVGSVTERVLRRVSIPVLVIPVHPD